MQLEDFKKKLRENPELVEFSETMAVIEANYDFTPTAFTNGSLKNEAGTNDGSCKILAFAKSEGLSKEETLACFGKYYFEDVLQRPDAKDHQNIRNFISTGLEGVTFKGTALSKK
jgi:hypothetical protein